MSSCKRLHCFSLSKNISFTQWVKTQIQEEAIHAEVAFNGTLITGLQKYFPRPLQLCDHTYNNRVVQISVLVESMTLLPEIHYWFINYWINISCLWFIQC